MSPIITTVVSALERAATLIEKGVAPSKALRQAGSELEKYARDREMARVAIPEEPWDIAA